MQPKVDIVPTEQTVPKPKPSVYPASCETYRPLIEQYSWDVRIAMAVMEAESGCNPNSANLNDKHNGCMGSFGLFQIACYDGQVYDPAKNIAIAWEKYKKRGWQPWGAYTSGAYKKYLR